MKKIFSFVEDKPWILLIFFALLSLTLFNSLFVSYFESDEWPLFTFYLPLINKPDGMLTALLSTILDNGALSGGQHVIPIASEIYFLNVLFFGLNFQPLALISLLLHATNSFLVFILVRSFISQKKTGVRNLYGIIAGLFFAVSPSPMHAITGAVPFYGQNVLSVTFLLSCLIFFKKAFIFKKKIFLYFSIVLLFLALFTKETTAFVFLLLPLLAFIEKRVFSMKYLAKLFFVVLLVYIAIRFVIPNVYSGTLFDVITDNYVSALHKANPQDTETIVSKDLSVHKNITTEIVFRSITFPIRMVSQVFVPRQTTNSLVEFVTSIIYPQLSGSPDPYRAQSILVFTQGIGNDLLVYLLSCSLIILFIFSAKRFYDKKEIEKLRTIVMGMAIIILSALPLVIIVIYFPRWGYDSYFDSRHLYAPTIGAAVLFPFFVFAIAKFVVSIRPFIRFSILTPVMVGLLILGWFINSVIVIRENMNIIVNLTGSPRRQIVEQLRKSLPVMPDKVVFFVETDGLGPYGSVLPFQTSVPQVMSIIYYDKNPLPDSFFNTFIFDGKPEGYKYAEGRGFGYFAYKKSLADALLTKQFSVDDIYSFYFEYPTTKITSTTQEIRKEMKQYMEESEQFLDWKLNTLDLSPGKISFSSPPSTVISEEQIATNDSKISKTIQLINPNFTAIIKAIHVKDTFADDEFTDMFTKMGNRETGSRKIFLDQYHYNNAIITTTDFETYYMMKFGDIIIIGIIQASDQGTRMVFEKILGSLAIIR